LNRLATLLHVSLELVQNDFLEKNQEYVDEN